EMQWTEEALAKRERECAAIEMAIAALGEANTELQTRFSPLLSRTAGAICAQLTGGRYKNLLFDKALQASARSEGDAVNRDILFMSGGTSDQIYLALRLAILQLLSGDEDPCPIILDDALVNFDDTRLGLALEFLYKAAQHRQILLFSCQSRERAYFASR